MKIRCPKLGDEVDFGYCRRENNGKPCYRIFDCWGPEVKDLLKEDELKDIKPPKTKIVSLIELIEKAKRKD